MNYIDIALTKSSVGYYDISIYNGDFLKTQGFDTAILITLMAERRASSSEVPVPENRRGWWGNPLIGFSDFEIGSKMWLLEQARMTQNVRNLAITYTRNAFQWFIDDSYLDNIIITANFDNEKKMTININFIRFNSKIFSIGYRLWDHSLIYI